VPESSLLRVPANHFARQWQEIRDDAIDAIDRVGRSGWLVLGEEVDAFERELAACWGVPHAIAVASGLDALEIALRCAGVPSGSRVLTTPLTAFATTLAIIRAGSVPVWCDVDQSGGLDLDRADAALRADRTIRAVVPVHLYGHPLDPEVRRPAFCIASPSAPGRLDRCLPWLARTVAGPSTTTTSPSTGRPTRRATA